MPQIEHGAVYERADIKNMFPTWDHATVTRWMQASGAWRPYPKSKKLLVLGSALIQQAGSQQTGGPLQPVDSGTDDLSPRLRALQSGAWTRRKVRS